MGLRERHSAAVFVRARQAKFDTSDEVREEVADWDPFSKMAIHHKARKEEKCQCTLLSHRR
jgi:hypothetical protein